MATFFVKLEATHIIIITTAITSNIIAICPTSEAFKNNVTIGNINDTDILVEQSNKMRQFILDEQSYLTYEQFLSIFDNYKDSVKFIENNPVDVGLSVSLLNGLKNISSDFALCITGDQPTVSSETFNEMINVCKNSDNPEKTIAVLRRRKTGLLDTAEGLGMPFVVFKDNMIKYLENENDNLNPILRKIFGDGYTFYGIKEKKELELLNINHYDDYLKLLDSL